MKADPASPSLSMAPSVPVKLVDPAPGPTAQQLVDLANKMLAGADHWSTLRDYDRTIQCHQAAAAYLHAALVAYANGV